VAAVVSMLSIGEGPRRETLRQLAFLGINNVIIKAKVPESITGQHESFARSPGLTLADGENIAQYGELVENVVGQRFESVTTVRHGSQEAAVRVVATFPSFVRSSAIEVEEGRFLTQQDQAAFAQVCVLGAKAKRSLFAFESPLGKVIRIRDLEFTVIGVMQDKYIGRSKVEGLELKNLNEDVYIPYNTALKKLDRALPTSALSFLVAPPASSSKRPRSRRITRRRSISSRYRP